jgi:NitT/TauT family transport system ATP-binding protein
MEVSAIEIDNVEHWFRDDRSGRHVHAVARTSFSVRDGEFVSVVGPSGCGKTTLLNIVSGLARQTRGNVRVRGKEVSGVQSNLVGYMFARDTLLPWRTAQSNVEFGLDALPAQEKKQRAQQYMHLVGLAGFEHAYPDQLSHGMRQRVALARTLAANPSILLMDEPFGALDAQTKLLMEEEVLKIWEANQKTVMFVTHDLVEALMLSDRVIVLSARPCRIKAEYRVEFPRPRDAEEMQANVEFSSLVRQVWHDLKGENIRGNQ